jgi:DNA-binding NtrC family response regulator
MMPLLEQADLHQTLSAASWSSVSPERTTETASASANLRGRRVLVIEDEPLIALDLTQILSDAGAIPLGPATTVEDALELISSTGFDAALVDANLGGKPVDSVAAELIRLGTPYVFVTGYGRDWLPADFQRVPIITKPLAKEIILETVARLIEEQPELKRSTA